MDFKNHCTPDRGEVEDTRVDSLPFLGVQVGAFVVCSSSEASIAKKDLRFKDRGLSGARLDVPALTGDVPLLREQSSETVAAAQSEVPKRHSLVVPLARQASVSPTVGHRSLAHQILPARQNQLKTTHNLQPSYASSRPRSPSAQQVSFSSECQETRPFGTGSPVPSCDIPSTASSQSQMPASLLQGADLINDTHQPHLAEVTPLPAMRKAQCGSAETFSATTFKGNEVKSMTKHFNERAVPILESRGTLIPRSLGPTCGSPRPPLAETPEAATDVSWAERSEFVLPTESHAADRPPEQGNPRHTALPGEAYAEGPHAAAHVPWATLAVMCMQAEAHWNYLHQHYPERCASVATILFDDQWERVVFAAFHHADVTHLVCGMFFFFFKALILEAAIGSLHFVALLAVVVVLVGLVNTFYALISCELTGEPSICTMCMHTFAGVIVALDMIIRRYLSDSTIHYGAREFGIRPLVCSMLELLVIGSCSEKNSMPIFSGYLAGGFLCGTTLGTLIVRIPNPRKNIYLCVVPNVPVTYFFVAAVSFAFLCGPYADTSTAAESTLTFRYPVWKPSILSPLYLEDIYQVAYVGLSLLAVGQDLERDLGHFSFLCVASGLLFAGQVLPEGLSWIAWRYAVAFREGVPAPVPSSSGSSSCSLVGTMLALKTIHHQKRREPRGYQVASFTIPVPFWVGILLELAHLRFFIPGSSTASHVLGVLAGLIVAQYREDCGFLSRIQRLRQRPPTHSIVSDEEEQAPANLWCQVCAARTTWPNAYRVPEPAADRDSEVLAEDDTFLQE
ncbi:hypothetical protein HPB49_018412 [Dermacentor silvarum]|uniref:Uncharacterized protein n=1 Tax=Dermacentor silvarum TaxID=543639 RepID=A0ACB8DQG1_DERSI|nr:hypothetical protein HPB49_018412 [Dermacentor silvarum]